jgi:hypothetical protein
MRERLLNDVPRVRRKYYDELSLGRVVPLRDRIAENG